MAITRKTITTNVTSAADTVLYTVPAATSAQMNVFIANGSSAATCRLAIVTAAGSVDWSLHSIVNEIAVNINTPISIGGLALATDDDIVGRSSTSSLSFVITGIEVT